MERTFPQKVKPVPSCEVEDGVMASQIRQAPTEVNRLVRTSAAMIGLAISVGTCSLPLPSQNDEAVAAEPVAGDATVSEQSTSALPSKFDVAAVSHKGEAVEQTQTLSPSGAIEHTVQEGQTLWQLAQLYRVDAATVASNNGISVGAVLHVGQILRIPVSGQSAPTALMADAANVPGYYGPIDGAKTVSSDRTTASQAQDITVLHALKQKQERLQLSLAQLKSSNQANAATVPEAVVSAVKPSANASYKVVLGDTLGAIAKVHGVSLKQLSAANHLTNPNVLNVDQVLIIPQANDRPAIATEATAPVMIASANPEQLTLPATDSQPQLFSHSKSVRSKPARLQKPIEGQLASQTESAIEQAPNVAVLPSPLRRATAVEQTVPAVSLNHSSISPMAIGGSTEIATASFVGNKPAQADQSGSSAQQSYVENLRLEIVKLREKYQDSANSVEAAAPSTRVAASSLNIAAPANTELASARKTELQPSGYTRALQAQIRQLQTNHQQDKRAEMKSAAADLAPVASPPKEQSQPQLVATASIGSQSYEPLIRSSVGQMVSPDLPPIGSVDAYLPGKSGKFNGYIWPAKGVLTSGYGYRWGRMHKGIDIAAPVGTPVFAAAAGVVVTAGWNSGGYGNMVEIQHPDGSVTLYAHNSRIVVREGQEVAQGEQIADMGSTGYSTGPHSHFEVHLPGQGAVNPMAHLPRNQA